MKQIIAISLLALLISAMLPKPNSEKNQTLPVHWKCKMGLTTHRTVPVLDNGILFIGSNGEHYRDFALDKNNGVHMLNLATGQLKKSFAQEMFGDMDVNGILQVDGQLYFGNDNDELLCYTKKGKISWRAPLIGDVESAPVMIKWDSQKAIVVGTEAGMLAAFDPKTGSRLWMNATNTMVSDLMKKPRSIVKINMHFYENDQFFMPPALGDLNLDGTTDLVYNSDGKLTAFNGANGEILWSLDDNAHPQLVLNTWRNTPLITGKGADLRIVLTAEQKIDDQNKENTTNHLLWVNRNGAIVDDYAFEKYASPVLNQVDDFFVTGCYIIHPGKNSKEMTIVEIDHNTTSTLERYGRFTHGQISEQLLEVNNEKCIMASFQYDRTNQSPCLALIGTKTGKIHMYAKLPSSSEFMPVLTDVNHDGKLDVLVGCYDQMLYCYDLSIPVSKRI